MRQSNLCKAKHPPESWTADLAVMQLTWLGQLALTPDGGVDAPQMGERGDIGQPIQHLQSYSQLVAELV